MKIVKRMLAVAVLILSLAACLLPRLVQRVYAASQINAIDSIVLTNEKDPTAILAEWSLLDPDINIYSDLKTGQAVKMFVNWSDQHTADLQSGDFFTFIIPDIFDPGFISNITGVDIYHGSNDVVATYSVYDNGNQKEVKITFTDYVDTHFDISGNFWILLFVGQVSSSESQTLEFTINGELAASGEVTIDPNESVYHPKDIKMGHSSPTDVIDGYYIFEWYVYFNMNESASGGFNVYGDFSFDDIIPPASPHVFLTDDIRQALGLTAADYVTEIGEYIGADAVSPENRYQFFVDQYNYIGGNWYDFIDWNPMVNGLASAGLDGNDGLDISGMDVADKQFAAHLGTLTRPIGIHYYTVATVKITEGALADTEVVGLFQNSFETNSKESLSIPLTLYRFETGGSAQGIKGDLSFSFTKVNEKSDPLSGAVFSLYVSLDFSAGADRVVYSDEDGIVTFNNLRAGTYFLQETSSPANYLLDDTIYKVILTDSGFEIYYGNQFENKLSSLGYQIVNQSEHEPLPVSVMLTGKKTLIGMPLTNEMFIFVVRDNNGAIVATGTNQTNGIICFTEIEFTAPGVYLYTVEEVTRKGDGIIYDDSKYTVKITISKSETGTLSAEVDYPDGEIVFTNEYPPPPPPPATGDTNEVYGWTLLLVCSLISMCSATLVIVKKRR